MYFGGIEPLLANADEVIVNMALCSFGSCAPIRVGPYLPSRIPCSFLRLIGRRFGRN